MGIGTCLILISVCADPVPGWTRTSAVPRATDASEGSLEEVVLRTATELLLEQASWRSYEDAVVALVEPSATLWGRPIGLGPWLPPDLATRGLPDDVEATTIRALDPRLAAAGPTALPSNLTLRRVEIANELRALDSAGCQRLSGADARIRIQEAWRRSDGSAIIHVEVMRDGPHDRPFAVTYDLTMEVRRHLDRGGGEKVFHHLSSLAPCSRSRMARARAWPEPPSPKDHPAPMLSGLIPLIVLFLFA